MGCGCNQKKRIYIVTKTDGSTQETTSLNEAMTVVRRFGGTYKLAMK